MEIKLVKNILSANDTIAKEIYDTLKNKNIVLINIMGTPGCGKTLLIEKTINSLKKRIGVIEGDITTKIDAERLSKYNIPVVQINTGGPCHLEALWIKSAINEFNLDDIDLIFIENVGNLVCPAEFSTGAHKNFVMISVTEGDDKPLKYPLAFQISELAIINKIDLLPYVDTDIELLEKNIKKANPKIEVIKLSVKTGDNLKNWIKILDKI